MVFYIQILVKIGQVTQIYSIKKKPLVFIKL